MYFGVVTFSWKYRFWRAVFNNTFAFVKQFVFYIIILWRKKEFVEYAVLDVG